MLSRTTTFTFASSIGGKKYTGAGTKGLYPPSEIHRTHILFERNRTYRSRSTSFMLSFPYPMAKNPESRNFTRTRNMAHRIHPTPNAWDTRPPLQARLKEGFP